MKQRLFGLLIVILIASMFLGACAKPQQPAGGDTGGQATEAVQPGAEAPAADLFVASNVLLDPALAVDEEDRALLPYLYEGLVRSEGDQIIPVLAKSWTVSVDELDYIFELRPGVTFHDGTPLNADAVIANFNRWFDPENPLHGSGAYEAWKIGFLGFKGETADGHPKSTFDGIEKVSEYSVLVHLNQPVDDFLFKLSDPAFAIASPAAMEAAGFGTKTGKEGGTGAYLLGEWGDGGLTFTPYSSYWNTEAAATKDVKVSFSD